MITKFKLLVILAISFLVLYTGCTFEDPDTEITIEEMDINISFDRDRYDFTKMLVTNNLDTIAIGDSIRVESIIDSSTIDFEDLRIESISENNDVYYPEELPVIPTGVYIPSLTFSDTIHNFGGTEAPFMWAYVDTGSFIVSIYNDYNQIEFDSIIIVIENDEDDTVSTSLIENLGLGLSQTSYDRIDGSYLTRGMRLIATFVTYDVPASQNSNGVNYTDNLNISITMGDCSIESALAQFHAQAIISDSLYTIIVDDIKAKEIVLKESEIRIMVDNNSPFDLDMRIQVDSLTSVVNPDSFFYQQKVIDEGTSSNLTPRDLENWRLKLTENNEGDMAIFIANTTYARSPTGSGTNMVEYHNTDRAKFYVVLTNSNSPQGNDNLLDFQAYSIEGSMINKEFKIDSTKTSLGDDIDWDEYTGLELDSIGVWLEIIVNNPDLEIQELLLDSLFMQGHSADSSSAKFEINVDPLYNISDTTIVRLYGLEDVINFHPDEISYEVKALINDNDITILDSDIINMNLKLGVPLQATFTDTVIIEGDVEAMEAVADTTSFIIESLYFNIDSYINNPFLDMETTLEVNLSESVEPNYDGDKDSLVGTIYTLLEAPLHQNSIPGSDEGYMLYDDAGSPLDNDAVNKLLSGDTYIQQKIIILPDTVNPVIMRPEDYIELQLKMFGRVKISLINEDDE